MERRLGETFNFGNCATFDDVLKLSGDVVMELQTHNADVRIAKLTIGEDRMNLSIFR